MKTHKRLKLILIVSCSVLFSVACYSQDNTQTEKSLPNIVIIYADDMGYGDVGYHGVENIMTPNIDALAKSGVYFTQGYVSSSICSPSRCGLLTGVYQQRYTSGQNPRASDPLGGLPLSQPMISEILKPAGYYSGIVGKWHLGVHESMRPMNRGWDEFYGFLNGSHSYFNATHKYTKIREHWPFFRGNEMVDFEGYSTEVFTDEAVSFIQRNKEKPFCLYVAYNAVHYPWEAPDKYIERVKFIENWNRRLFAGMVLALDDGVGLILETLENEGLNDNTIVFFISDNGSPRGQPGNMSSTGPLRGWKGDTFEGGIRIPFIIKWPGEIPPGTKYEQPVITLDILPSLLSYIGLENIDQYKFDGVNILPYLNGEKPTNEIPHQNLFWKRGGDMAIRSGDWKLMLEDRRNAPKDTMLFYLAKDIGEQTNLINQYPDKAMQLQNIYKEWEDTLPEFN
jgi:arylsulfatase A-like enzyme